ncbi:MAG: acetyl-CoA hydrolase, partial [Halioglobus sp.]|nr:acetyl-CoA hydrolase [Halioglobus sp.]
PMRAGKLPPNVRVSELYFKAGSMKAVPVAQQNYISSNYTHIARDMVALGVNVVAQLVAMRDSDGTASLSLSCNPDVSPEIFRRLAESGRPCFKLAQVHPELPFMEHDAEVPAETFDLIVRNPQYDKALFAVPNGAVPIKDYATALHASSLVEDGGTLQIGIGSLGDAVAHACILRHRQNDQYRAMLDAISHAPVSMASDRGLFSQGLYVSTEMFVNGMLQLMEQGIVRRRVYDDLALQQGLNSGEISEAIDERLYDYACEQGVIPQHLDDLALSALRYWGLVGDTVELRENSLCIAGEAHPNDTRDSATRSALLGAAAGRSLRNGRFLHGGFFLGPRDFYRKLSELDAAGREGICMTGVNRTNQLLLNYPLYCAQRRDARFINTGMIVSLGGAVASDALQDGTVISGVGGQYNFVAMAHDLPGARSILCIRSTRGQGKHLQSNIVPYYGHTTIPRHLRDVVVTEYGVADLRGQSDAEVAKRLIAVADSRFQDELLEFAQQHGKVEKAYRLPQSVRNNSPERLIESLAPYRQAGLLPDYPFGTELTEQEITLADSLRKIKALSEEPGHFIATVFKALLHREDEQAARPYLERIHLEHPETTKDFLVQQLLLLELEERGLLKVS